MSHHACKELLVSLSDYLDGEAAEALCTEIERHLAGCEDCRVVVDTLRKTILLYRTLPPPAPPQTIRARLLHALELDKDAP
ncbi:MAG: zf-HC2 domain-containing protein [Caldilinea sp.]|nr:zf-HC2 domain-containing protein [Caldilinea sp.]MDW8441160.1 anti-sigma factor [Caldilineaceae bacterium]